MKLSDAPTESVRYALWAFFPTLEIFHDFIKEKRNIPVIKKLIALAHEKKLIEKFTEVAFQELLAKNMEMNKNRRPAMEFTFESLLGEIKQDKSIKSLVGELKEMAGFLSLEEPDEVLFTRMKKDFHFDSLKRRHALILLAIWLGLNKSHLGVSYRTMLAFPRNSEDVQGDETAGVVAAFAFQGDTIDANTVEFLKRELPACIKDLKLTYLNEKRVNFLATSCMTRFPVKAGAPGFPPTLGQAMRDALSLAYQMMVTWQLSPMNGSRIHLIIAIDAGEFPAAEINIKDLMVPDLPTDQPIRLSHLAFTAARQAHLKVVFKAVRSNVWAAEHFWAFLYFRHPPASMPKGAGEKGLLPVTDAEVREFRKDLFLGDAAGPGIHSLVNQYPPKVISSLEVAHVATLRRLHHEAVQLLSSVLSFDHMNYIARTLRMHNFMSLGTYARELDAAEMFFERGIQEGLFIEHYCPADPEFYAEFSLIHWARAIKLIRLLRKGLIGKETIEEKKAQVFESLRLSEQCAKKGLAASTSGADSRCIYWLAYSAAFRRMLETDGQLLTDGRKPLEDNHGIFPALYDISTEVFGQVLPGDSSGFIDRELMDARARSSVETHLNSFSSTSQYSHAAFGVCSFLWDFSGPERKKMVIDHVLLILDVILVKIDELKPLCLGSYSATPALAEVQSPAEYAACIGKVKKAVQKVKETGDYSTGMKLLFVNIDFESGTAPITFDLIRKEDGLNKKE